MLETNILNSVENFHGRMQCELEPHNRRNTTDVKDFFVAGEQQCLAKRRGIRLGRERPSHHREMFLFLPDISLLDAS